MRVFFNTCGIVFVLLALVYFAMNNSQYVTITLYNGQTETFQLWAVIMIPFFAGVIAGNLLDVLKRFRLASEIRTLRRQLKKASDTANRPFSG